MQKKEKIPLLFIGLMVVIFPLARFSGMVFQAYRGGGVIQGNCVAYDTLSGQVYATPYNLKCLNFGDWLLLITAALSPICGCIFYFLAKTKNPFELFRDGFADAKKKNENLTEAKKLKLFSFFFDFTLDVIRSEEELEKLKQENVQNFFKKVDLIIEHTV